MSIDPPRTIMGPINSRFLMVMAIIFLFSCGGDDENEMNLQDDDVSPTLGGLTMLSRQPIDGILITDVWGYLNDGREYAIIGDFSMLIENSLIGSVTIVDVTDPADPEIVSVISDILGFDVKVWNNYLYISNGAFFEEVSPSLIYDISDPANPLEVGEFPNAHNVTIDENGYMYLQNENIFNGLFIYDLNQSPTNPVNIWVDSEPHPGHDATIIGNRLYDYHYDLGTIIYDISNPTEPLLLSRIDQLDIDHHCGSATEDNRILVISDETKLLNADGVDLSIWDVSDPATPTLLSTISNDTSVAHNLIIKDELLYVAHYDAGLLIYDIEDPSNPVLLDVFDTNAIGGTGLSPVFQGAFGVYVNERTGNIYVSDIDNGLYIFSFEKPN